MPATYTIDVKRGTVFSKAHGKLNDADLMDHLKRLSADPEFRSDFNQLSDFREVTSLEVSTNAIKELAANSPYGKGSRRAFVVNSPLAFGLARIYQAMVDDPTSEIKVFKDYSQACQWLGLREALD